MNNVKLYLLALALLWNLSLTGQNIIADAGPDQFFNCVIDTITIGSDNTSMGAEFEYEWRFGSTDIVSTEPFYTTTSAGPYILTVTNTLTNEMASDTVVLGVSIEFYDLFIAQSGELNCSNSTIFLEVFNEIFYFEETSVLWEATAGGSIVSDPTLQIIEIDGAGVYTVTVTNLESGCTATETIFIDVIGSIPQFTIEYSTLELNCEFTVIPLDAVVSNISGDGPFTFTWFDIGGNVISTFEAIDVTEPGVYSLVVTDVGSGCINEQSIVITLDENLPVIVINNPLLLIEGQTLQLDASGSDSGSDIIYEWETSDGNIVSGANTLTPIVDATGTYCLRVIDTSNGCFTEGCVEVMQSMNATVVADAGPDQTLTCATGAMSGIGGPNTSMGPEFTYEWTDALGIVIGTTPFITVSAPGLYTLTVTNTITGEVATDQVEFVQDIETPSVTIDEPDILSCSKSSVILNATVLNSGDFAFEWTDSAGNVISDSEDISVEEPGTYTLTVFNLSNGCFTSNTVSVLIDNAIPTVFVDIQQPVTCEDTISLDPRQFISLDTLCTYAWAAQDGLSVDADEPIIAIFSITDTYTLVKTDTLTGCEQHFLFSTIVNGGLVADAGPDVVITCAGSTLDALGSPNTTTGPDISYSWTTIDGSIFGPTDQPTAAPLSAGTYTLEVTDQTTGCIAIDEVAVTSIPKLQVSISTTDVSCFGLEDGGADITVVGGVPPYTFMTPFEPTTTGLAAGLYDVSVFDGNGCLVITTIEIIEPEELTATIMVNGEGNVQADVIGGVMPYTYDWNVDADGPIIVNPVNGTNYELTVTDANGCILETSFFFSMNAVDRSSTKELKLYPNPTLNNVTIELENISSTLEQMKVIDVQGRSMKYTRTFTDHHTLQLLLDDLTSGTYIIHAIIDDQLFYQKLVIIK